MHGNDSSIAPVKTKPNPSASAQIHSNFHARVAHTGSQRIQSDKYVRGGEMLPKSLLAWGEKFGREQTRILSEYRPRIAKNGWEPGRKSKDRYPPRSARRLRRGSHYAVLPELTRGLVLQSRSINSLRGKSQSRISGFALRYLRSSHRK